MPTDSHLKTSRTQHTNTNTDRSNDSGSTVSEEERDPAERDGPHKGHEPSNQINEKCFEVYEREESERDRLDAAQKRSHAKKLCYGILYGT